MVKVIDLPEFKMSITVNTDTKAGSISSSLAKNEDDLLVKDALNAIESIILAHACEGIDIQTTAYLNGVRTTLDAISNQE